MTLKNAYARFAVFKYPIIPSDWITIELPRDAKVLTVQVQRTGAYLWVLVDPSAPLEPRHFRLAGTGHPITVEQAADLIYVGTFQLYGGDLVFHLFEIKK